MSWNTLYLEFFQCCRPHVMLGSWVRDSSDLRVNPAVGYVRVTPCSEVAGRVWGDAALIHPTQHELEKEQTLQYGNGSSCSFLSSLLIGLEQHLWSTDWLLGPVLGSQWWEMKVNILPHQKRRVIWEEKATGASWGTRQDGINQSSPKCSRPNQNPISFMKPFQIPLLEINLRAPMSPGPLACTFPSILTTIYLVLEWFMHMSASPTKMWVPEDRNIYEGPFDDFDYCVKDQHNNINNLPHILRWFYAKIIKTECSLKNYFHIFIIIAIISLFFFVHFIDAVQEAESLLWPVQGHRTSKQVGWAQNLAHVCWAIEGWHWSNLAVLHIPRPIQSPLLSDFIFCCARAIWLPCRECGLVSSLPV